MHASVGVGIEHDIPSMLRVGVHTHTHTAYYENIHLLTRHPTFPAQPSSYNLGATVKHVKD